MQDVKINNKTYEGVQTVQIPLSDGSGNANFIDTSNATASAENIDKGYNAYIGGELVIGTKEETTSLVKMKKIGTYNWSNPEGSQVIIEECVADLSAYAKNWYTETEQTGSNSRLGIIIIADEKPTSTNGIKAIICAANYETSSESITGLPQPVNIMSGSYYGGLDGVSYAAIASLQTVSESDIPIATTKLTECSTCSIYTFDINF